MGALQLSNTPAHTDKCLKKAVPSHLPSCQGLAQQHMSIVQVCSHQLPPFLTLMSHILEGGNGKKKQNKIYVHMKEGKQVMAEEVNEPFPVFGETAILHCAVTAFHSNGCCTLLCPQKAWLRCFFFLPFGIFFED